MEHKDPYIGVDDSELPKLRKKFSGELEEAKKQRRKAMDNLESVINDCSSSGDIEREIADVDRETKRVSAAEDEITKAELNLDLIRGRGVSFDSMSEEDKKFVNNSLFKRYASAATRSKLGDVDSVFGGKRYDPARVISQYMDEIKFTKKSYPNYSVKELTEAYESTTSQYDGELIKEAHKNGCTCHKCEMGLAIQKSDVDPSMKKLIDVGLVRREY